MSCVHKQQRLRAVKTIISWIIALLRGYLGAKADIAAKQQQEVGREKQIVADQTVTIKDLQDGKKIETTVLSEPDSAAGEWLHSHGPRYGK